MTAKMQEQKRGIKEIIKKVECKYANPLTHIKAGPNGGNENDENGGYATNPKTIDQILRRAWKSV